MDVLLSFDKTGYQKAESELQNIAETYMQDIVNHFLNLNIGKLEQPSFIKLFTSTSEVVFNKITGGSLTISNVSISKEKAMELIEKPIGYSELIEKINSTVTYLKDKIITKLNKPIAAEIANIFLLNENDEVELNKEFLSMLENRYKKYAVTESAKKMFSFANTILEKYKELDIDKINSSSGDSIGSVINQLLRKEGNKPIEINTEGIFKFNYS